MLIKRLIFILTLPAFLAGCSEFFGSQPPAPVYGNGSTVSVKTKPALPKRKPKAQKPKKVEPIIEESTEIVKTKPLQEFVPITEPLEALEPEPLAPEQQQQPQQQQQQQGLEALAPAQGGVVPGQSFSAPGQEPTKPNLNPSPSPSPSQEPVVIAPKPEFLAPPPPPPPPPPLPPAFEPLETFAPLSPAVSALALAATQNSKSGNIESATTTIERAIRIEPRNATLYYKLALLKLKQSKPRLAEDLAKKAALLASNDAQLKKHSWLLVARAREMQGDLAGGKEARAKAGKF
ncbi:MAG: hypothetical protein WCS87_04515 [Methylococcaceae bacterium]